MDAGGCDVAAVGVDTFDRDDDLTVVTLTHDHVDRAVAEGRTDGFTKIVVDGGRVVGATVVGPRAGESLGELSVAVARGLKARDLAGVIHPYPTWNDGPWNALRAEVRTTPQRPSTQRVTGTLVSARRWWRERTRRG